MVKSNSKRFYHSRKMNLYAYNRYSNKHLQRNIQGKFLHLENEEESFKDNATVKKVKKYLEKDRVNQQVSIIYKQSDCANLLLNSGLQILIYKRLT